MDQRRGWIERRCDRRDRIAVQSAQCTHTSKAVNYDEAVVPIDVGDDPHRAELPVRDHRRCESRFAPRIHDPECFVSKIELVKFEIHRCRPFARDRTTARPGCARLLRDTLSHAQPRFPRDCSALRWEGCA